MDFGLLASLAVLGLFAAMLVLLESGRRIGTWREAEDEDKSRAGLAAVDGAVFTLLGLLVAFTFSGAWSRFETRRQLIVEEANDIGTAWLRLDLLPAGAQPALREDFRRYVDSRLKTYELLPDLAAAKAELDKSAALQRDIWNRSVAGSRDAEVAPSAQMLLLNALNQMIDITTTRTMAARMHPPLIIFILLILLALTSALLAGYGMAGGRSRSWTHIIGFTAILACTIFVILDLEYPRMGFIRIDPHDQVLVEVRQSMK